MERKNKRKYVLIIQMDSVYKLTPTAWKRFCKARSEGDYPEPGGKGWTYLGEPINVTDMEDEDFTDLW